MKGLYGAVPLAHYFLKERLKKGDKAVDATCGNGHDTLFMAKLVGESGKAFGFDTEPKAIEATRKRVLEAGYDKQTELILDGHENISKHLSEPVNAIIFNLGYLPGGDYKTKTAPETTIAALESSVNLLLTEGIIIIAVYTGHEGGEEEWKAIQSWSSALSPSEFNVWKFNQLNRGETAPFTVFIEKT
ncbi:MAG: methyltransferase domain-containing protein [Desulfuromonadales bacterium]|nr:methyltransferase domain-containing protein [Desulfuromonadales bacterium]